jgi:hypothetical protein
MPRKLWPCIMLLSLSAWAKEGDPYVEKLWDKKYLKFSTGEEVLLADLEKHGGEANFHRLFLRKGKKILWDKTFSQEYGALWNRAYFIPLVPRQFIADLNNDGFSEIAVATWHGGNAVWSNLAIIFTLKNDQLEFLKTFPINIEFSRSIYENKSDFDDQNYKCKHCQ